MVSKRIAKYGLKLVKGDLVILKGTKMNSKDLKVTIINDSNIKEYSIEDIVMTVPGTEVTI